MNNTYGTHVLLEASRNYGKVQRFINVSTDEVYGESSFGLNAGLQETSTLEPTNPYSAAKVQIHSNHTFQLAFVSRPGLK